MYKLFAVLPNPLFDWKSGSKCMMNIWKSLWYHWPDHHTMDKYHDSRFWSEYKTNLDKIAQVLNVIAAESVTITKAYNTFAVKGLLMSKWSLIWQI
jgi:hypothetical protein